MDAPGKVITATALSNADSAYSPLIFLWRSEPAHDSAGAS